MKNINERIHKSYKHIPQESIEDAQTPMQSAKEVDGYTGMVEPEDQPILDGKKKSDKRNSRRY